MAETTTQSEKMNARRIALAVGLVLILAAATASAQEPSGLEAAAVLESSLTHAIAAAEKSVVAIARVRKEPPGDSVRLEYRPDPFGNRPALPDPNFVPNEYGTGVIVDRRGLVLTAAHVLGDENDSYYVTTSEPRVYRAWVVAADPRSDLAVLNIAGADAGSLNLAPIRLGDAASLRKGQIIVTLGNPYAIARDGQASAGWGIVSNLGRKAHATAGWRLSRQGRRGKPTPLAALRRFDPDRRPAAPGHQRRSAAEPQGRNGGAVHFHCCRFGLRIARRFCHPGR